jgi:hypothetical protein
MIPNVKPELAEMIQQISTRSMYYGNRIPASIMAMFTIIETDLNAGVLVPFWLGVLQRGRGKRKATQSSGLVNTIYRWMERRSMFRSKTATGKFNEAKRLTWYINKYGNAHFRSQRFVDIYESARKSAIVAIDKKFAFEINKITMDVI